MAEDNQSFDVVKALQGIQNELQRLNQTLSAMAAQQSRSAAPSQYTARTASSTRSASPARSKEGGYSRPERLEGVISYGSSDKPTSRYPKKSGTGYSKSKSPTAKKGDGYPKKPR